MGLGPPLPNLVHPFLILAPELWVNGLLSRMPCLASYLVFEPEMLGLGAHTGLTDGWVYNAGPFTMVTRQQVSFSGKRWTQKGLNQQGQSQSKMTATQKHSLFTPEPHYIPG